MNEGFGWGVIIGFRHDCNRFITSQLAASSNRDDFVIDVLLPCAAGTAAAAKEAPEAVRPLPTAMSDPTAEAHIVPVRLSLLTRLSAARLWLPSDLRSASSKRRCLEGLRQLMATESRLGTVKRAEAACLHPIAHLGASDDKECSEAMGKVETMVDREMELEEEIGIRSVRRRRRRTEGHPSRRARWWIRMVTSRRIKRRRPPRLH